MGTAIKNRAVLLMTPIAPIKLSAIPPI